MWEGKHLCPHGMKWNFVQLIFWIQSPETASPWKRHAVLWALWEAITVQSIPQRTPEKNPYHLRAAHSFPRFQTRITRQCNRVLFAQWQQWTSPCSDILSDCLWLRVNCLLECEAVSCGSGGRTSVDHPSVYTGQEKAALKFKPNFTLKQRE